MWILRGCGLLYFIMKNTRNDAFHNSKVSYAKG